MLRREHLVFDNVAPRKDEVVIAIEPFDSFTGEIVSRSLDVILCNPISGETLPYIPRKNLSGVYVFVNIDPLATYQVKISAKGTGYFDPAPINFTPPVSSDPDRIAKLRLLIKLYSRPERASTLDATVIAGTVERSTQPVAAAEIKAELIDDVTGLPIAGKDPFIAYSDSRGSFAVPLRMQAEAATGDVDVKFTLSDSLGSRSLTRKVSERNFYSFEYAVDLTGSSGSTQPELKKFGG